MTIKDYCKINDVHIDEKELEYFEKATKVDANQAFDKIRNALIKYNVDDTITRLILTDTDTWCYLYKNPEETIKKFIKNGKVDGGSLYACATVD
ncbi:MAG: hypothetical protein VZQ61_04775 [Christensenellaceae bacterium]